MVIYIFFNQNKQIEIYIIYKYFCHKLDITSNIITIFLLKYFIKYKLYKIIEITFYLNYRNNIFNYFEPKKNIYIFYLNYIYNY